MDLVGTLGKMILNSATSGKGAGGALGSLLGGAQGQSGGGGLADLLGGLAGAQGGGAGGLGDLLSKLGQQGGASGSGSGGAGAGGLLGGLLGGSAASGGGLGDLLGSALGGQLPGASQPAPATPEQNDHAGLLIRAMVNAAKSHGGVDQEEQEKIVGQLGEIGPEEAAFIRSEMQAPLDVRSFVNSVPRGMEQQVYLISLMAINLDAKEEADYLDQLAKGLNISEQDSNQLHAQVGAPQLYT